MPGGRPIRVMMVITDLEVGGTPLDVHRLATSLPRDRFRVLVASLADAGPVGAMLRDAGVPVKACCARGVADLAAMRRLVQITRQFRPDVVHSFLFHANMAARLAGLLVGRSPGRLVCSILTVEIERRWHLWAEAMTCRLCRCVIGNSASVVDHLFRAGHVPRSRLRLIPGGLDVDSIAAARPVARADLGVPDGVPLVLWVGRLDPVKGLDELIEATALLVRRGRPLRVLLAGVGRYESTVRALIAKTRMGPFVRLLGRRDDVASLVAAADCFVFPSRSEGLPNALIEAMAAGKPIVATDAPGCRDLIRDGVTGLLAPVRSPVGLANAIDRLLGDPVLGSRLGRAAREWARTHHAWRRVCGRWVELYEEVAGEIVRA